MKIIIAPNALKSSLSAGQAAEAIAAGCRQAAPLAELVPLPVADGGDGLVPVLTQALQAIPKTTRVNGPLGQPVEAGWLYCEASHTAVIEMAAAAGLALLDPQQLAPMDANTRGVGELILAALDAGAQRILLGIGGSATSDGGMGMVQALGVVFRDREGQMVEAGGGCLTDIAVIDISGLDPRLKKVHTQVICDVDNPLLGARGAARVFAPQKGANTAQVEQLEAGLTHYAGQLDHFLGKDVRNIPGAGAAGGLGAGAIAFLNAELKPGAELVLELLKFDDALEGADLVITAEGQLDGQTAFGKAPAAVARHASAKGLPCIAIAGSLGEGANTLDEIGITDVYTLCRDTITMEDAIANAAEYVREAAALATRTFLAPQQRTRR